MKNIIITVFLLIIGINALMAVPTTVIVRARAKDAKFIGTGMGGAYVVIKNQMTGEVLAKGLTAGNSGNTSLLLQTPLTRRQSITDRETARFEATIDISDPVFIEVEVTAPVTRKNASVKASTQLWLIPGKNITGDGVVLELPGFIVDLLSPTTHEIILLEKLENKSVIIKSSVTMLCGCTITSGGIWNADGIEVAAIIKKDGKDFMKAKMNFTGKANIFESNLNIDNKGIYQVTIYAYDPVTGNTGVDQTNFVIQ